MTTYINASNLEMQPTIWEYEDSIGVTRRGIMVGSTDFGGNDVSTHMRRVEDGRLDILAGKQAAGMRVAR